MQLELFCYLSVYQLVFKTGLDQVEHALLHVRCESVVIDFLVDKVFTPFKLLLLRKLFKFFGADLRHRLLFRCFYGICFLRRLRPRVFVNDGLLRFLFGAGLANRAASLHA